MSQVKCFFVSPITVESNFTCRAHDHFCTELVLHNRSEGWIVEGKKRFEYGHNDIVIHQPGVDHWVENTRKGTHFCIGISGDDAASLPVGVFPTSEEIRRTFQQINDEILAEKDDRLSMLDVLCCLLVIQLKRFLQPRCSTPRASLHVRKAKQILDTRFKESINFSDVASSLYISQDYLRQLFKETYGDSPIHYLIKKRLDFACEMLKMTDRPIHEIAVAAGIDNPYYFSRIFKKIKGCSPSQFRGR